FWRITVPLLRPTLAIAVLFRVLQAFGLFDLPFVMTNGGPGTATPSLPILGYKAIFQNLDFGTGAAVATTTALLVLIGCLISLRGFKLQVGKEGMGWAPAHGRAGARSLHGATCQPSSWCCSSGCRCTGRSSPASRPRPRWEPVPRST